jgi:predicted Zn finger-like uncharacterized protein
MIVSCPACAARLRLDRRRLGGKRVTLRCGRCREVFKVEVPSVTVENTGFSVLVAHSDRALCATIEEILNRAGLSCRTCHDGQDALALMAASPPQVAVVDVALPGLFAFEVVEKVRKGPGLEEVKILLLSSVYNRMAYKRTPTSLYGADDYIEKHHIPDDLVTKINRLAVNAVSAPPGEQASGGVTVGQTLQAEEKDRDSRVLVDEVKERIRSAEENEVSGEANEERILKARRLARIIVSDIALYNQDRVEEGIRQGTFHHLLSSEIDEGKRLFKERIAPEIRSLEDFLEQAFATFIERRKIELCLQERRGDFRGE